MCLIKKRKKKKLIKPEGIYRAVKYSYPAVCLEEYIYSHMVFWNSSNKYYKEPLLPINGQFVSNEVKHKSSSLPTKHISYSHSM